MSGFQLNIILSIGLIISNIFAVFLFQRITNLKIAQIIRSMNYRHVKYASYIIISVFILNLLLSRAAPTLYQISLYSKDNLNTSLLHTQTSLYFKSSIYIIIMLMIPFLASIEEWVFRKGGIVWKDITIRSILFGLFHLPVGVSLGGCIVLSAAGFILGKIYRRLYYKYLVHENKGTNSQNLALTDTINIHTIINWIIITLTFVLCIAF